MNAMIVHKINVKSSVMDALAKELPDIISDALELPGGKLAILKPEQVALEFSEASPRDTGSDIKIMLFARNLILRSSNDKELANKILENVVLLTTKLGDEYSIDVRLYLVEIGAAEHSLSK